MPTRKPVRWIGSSREDLRDFPAEVQRMIGYALHFAQMGDKHPSAKPLQGFEERVYLKSLRITMARRNTAKVALSAQLVGMQQIGDSLPSAYFVRSYIASEGVSS